MKRKFVLGLLIASIGTLSADEPAPVDPGPPQDSALAICVLACAGLAVGAIYIVAHRCEPKYYWLCDDDNPPKFWVATATKKQCAIEGWHRIGGPYKRPQDAPTVHPDATNRVELAASSPMNIAVEASTDAQNWSAVYQETCDTEDFGYTFTPTNAAMFRLCIKP